MSRGPKNFEDAIEKLGDKAEAAVDEAAESAPAAAGDALGELEREFRKIWSSLQSLTGGAGPGVQRAKDGAEEAVTQNPWVSIAAVGLIAFLIGYLLGGRRAE